MPSNFLFAERNHVSSLPLGFPGILTSLGVCCSAPNRLTKASPQTGCLEFVWSLVAAVPADVVVDDLLHGRSPFWNPAVLLRLTAFTFFWPLPFRLPGPTARVAAAGSEAKTRGGSTAANNRRSQSFNNYDKSKPVPSPPQPAPTSNHEKGESFSSESPVSLSLSRPIWFLGWGQA